MAVRSTIMQIKFRNERSLLQLPLYTCSAESLPNLEMQRRADFVRAHVARRSHPDAPQLDPVLRFHLGLTPPVESK